MTTLVFKLIFLGCSLANVREEEDAWIDPFNMTHYDSTSKSMKKISEEPKGADKDDPPIRDLDQNEDELMDPYEKIAILRSGIEDVKLKASVLKQKPKSITAQNQLLKSIEQLRMPHEDDVCPDPWLSPYLEARRCISVGLLIAATHFTDLVVPVGWFVSFLFLCVYMRQWRGQPDGRDGPERNGENDLQNDNRAQERQEGDRDNMDPEDLGAEPGPPEEHVVPEQAEGRSPSEAAGQEPDASGDECCDENYSITKMPITETQPEAQHFAE